MSLTTQLLADAVEKGGPGSGPQGGRSSKQTVLSASNQKLMDSAKSAGTKLYGKGLELDSSNVKTGSLKGYLGDSDAGKTYDTYDYVFKPSTGKAIDVADTSIRASHADVDGKIYIAGANGVYVINSTKGLPK